MPLSRENEDFQRNDGSCPSLLGGILGVKGCLQRSEQFHTSPSSEALISNSTPWQRKWQPYAAVASYEEPKQAL
jgi:hypothetical protein